VIIEGLTSQDKKEILELILLQLSDTAKKENVSFIRISPIFIDNDENRDIFIDLGFRNAPMHASAYEATWKLDIYPEEDELLKNMRKTTRYLIKKVSENTDISIEKSLNTNDIGIYQKLNKEVSKRQRFVPFSDESIKNEFEVFANNKEIVFLFGKYKGEIVAGAMIIFWSGTAFYHQAASLGKFAKLSIPYLLQWEAIKEAKNRMCAIYDFWGFTDPEKFPKHPWAGPTLFKMGFGGYNKNYIKTQDFVITKKYWLNYIIEKIRKITRGL
ncbi:MAG: peptidoglycan bridge formation glycyltransferase FemA/FemB family protein, partial [Candidatus Staskawiczbacteria bacterium]